MQALDRKALQIHASCQFEPVERSVRALRFREAGQRFDSHQRLPFFLPEFGRLWFPIVKAKENNSLSKEKVAKPLFWDLKKNAESWDNYKKLNNKVDFF